MKGTKEIAEELGLSIRRVQQARETLGLGQKIGKTWIYTDEEMEKIRERIGKRGRPK